MYVLKLIVLFGSLNPIKVNYSNRSSKNAHFVVIIIPIKYLLSQFINRNVINDAHKTKYHALTCVYMFC